MVKVKVVLNEEIKRTAQQKAQEFTDLNNTKNNQIFIVGDNRQKKHIAFLGELAFAKWLDQQHIKYETDDVIGRSDKYDFLIMGKKIDVKTTSLKPYKEYNCFFVNKIQADKQLHQDYYVFIVINRGEAEIYGFEKARDVPKLYPVNTKIPSPAYEIGARDLTSINQLRKELINSE